MTKDFIIIVGVIAYLYWANQSMAAATPGGGGAGNTVTPTPIWNPIAGAGTAGNRPVGDPIKIGILAN